MASKPELLYFILAHISSVTNGIKRCANFNIAENIIFVDSGFEHSIRKDGWIPYHSIKIKKNTILHQLLDIEEYTVSSTHHQCIKKLGMNIVASAYSADGIVEAIELCSDKQKIIGFQGHIENILTNYTEYNKIIKYILS